MLSFVCANSAIRTVEVKSSLKDLLKIGVLSAEHYPIIFMIIISIIISFICIIISLFGISKHVMIPVQYDILLSKMLEIGKLFTSKYLLVCFNCIIK